MNPVRNRTVMNCYATDIQIIQKNVTIVRMLRKRMLAMSSANYLDINLNSESISKCEMASYF